MRRVAVASLALGWLAGAQAQEAEVKPELDFFEYLGAWAGDDDEWLAIEEWQKDEAVQPEEDPEGSERAREDEDDDESE